MRIAVVGAGPAGCAAALSLRRRLGASTAIRVFEREPSGGRRGFGLVFPPWQPARLAFAGHDWARDLEAAALGWDRLAVVREGERVVLGGHPMKAICRDRLLGLLRGRLAREGVPIEYGSPVASRPGDADLVVAADGCDSVFRGAGTVRRDPAVATHFVWFATRAAFPELTFLFRRTRSGVFTAHAYSYSADRSAFIVEAAERTWSDALGGGSAAGLCAAVFAGDLGGRTLFGGSGVPRPFAQISVSRWFADGAVLIGDAAHTAHFSIGSGTSLALADAAALADALAEHPTVEQAVTAYECRRRPPVETAQTLSRLSSQWFATVGERMDGLDAQGLAESLVSRSGLMARLRDHAKGEG